MRPDWDLIIQILTVAGLIFACLGTPVGWWIAMRESRIKEPLAAAQTNASAMAATKDEFTIMDIALKRQEAINLEQRAANAQQKALIFEMQDEHRNSTRAMQIDFSRQLAERDETRKQEREKHEAEINTLREALKVAQDAADKAIKDAAEAQADATKAWNAAKAAQTRVKELEKALADAEEKIKTLNADLEREREINTQYAGRLSDIEAKQGGDSKNEDKTTMAA